MADGDLSTIHFTITEDTYSNVDVEESLIDNYIGLENYKGIGVDVLVDTGSSGITKTRVVLSLLNTA